MLRPVSDQAEGKGKDAGAGTPRPVDSIRVSSGTMSVFGLSRARPETAPTTAYLMVGERCLMDCAFCSQARSAATSAEMLSRVSWPACDNQVVVQAAAAAKETGQIGRVCFQMVAGRETWERTRQAVLELRAASAVPICVSATASNLKQVEEILEWGSSRVTLALDAAAERIYSEVKGGGSWRARWYLLRAAAGRFPGRIGTHLIVGLGETEREMLETIQACLDMGATVALFAFTPVRGTRMQAAPPPDPAAYRRIQAAHFLMKNGLVRLADMQFDSDGRLVSFGKPVEEVKALLVGGDAFRTSGCKDCNRPYYNEHPGGFMYNHPRPLTADEATEAIELTLSGIRDTASSPAVSGSPVSPSSPRQATGEAR